MTENSLRPQRKLTRQTSPCRPDFSLLQQGIWLSKLAHCMSQTVQKTSKSLIRGTSATWTIKHFQSNVAFLTGETRKFKIKGHERHIKSLENVKQCRGCAESPTQTKHHLCRPHERGPALDSTHSLLYLTVGFSMWGSVVWKLMLVCVHASAFRVGVNVTCAAGYLQRCCSPTPQDLRTA